MSSDSHSPQKALITMSVRLPVLQQMMLIPCTDRQLKDDSMLFQEEKKMKLREKSDVRKGQELEGE